MCIAENVLATIRFSMRMSQLELIAQSAQKRRKKFEENGTAGILWKNVLCFLSLAGYPGAMSQACYVVGFSRFGI